MQGTFRKGRFVIDSLHYCIAISSCFGFALCLLLFSPWSVVQARTSKTVIVQINGSKRPSGFFPAFLTVHVNETVVFVNQAFPKNAYSVVAVDGSFSSPPIPVDQRWKVSFTSPGTHEYRSQSAPVQMVGVLLVVNADVALLPVPNPLVEATVLAVINNRLPLPETPLLPLTKPPHAAAPATPSFLPVILAIAFGISSVVLLGFFLVFYRRYQTQHAAMVVGDDDAAEPSSFSRLVDRLFTFFSQSGHWFTMLWQWLKTFHIRNLFRKKEDDDEDL
jgi:plastocyanin